MITLMRRMGTDGRKRLPPREFGAPTLALVGCGRNEGSLRSALEEGGARVRIPEGRELEGLVAESQVDLVVLGSALEESCLWNLLAELRGRDAPVLFLAPEADGELAQTVLAAGADDVLPPPHSGHGILFRFRIMVARTDGHRDGDRQRRFGGRLLDREGRRLVDGTKPIHLSVREFELLSRLLEEEGGVVPRKVLLRDIWGDGQDSEGVLEATVHRLRRKLEEDTSEPRHLTTVRGVGYRLEPGS